MCYFLTLPDGTSVETVGELRAAFPERPLVWKPYVRPEDLHGENGHDDPESCLCHIDLAATIGDDRLRVDEIMCEARLYGPDEPTPEEERAERLRQREEHRARREAERLAPSHARSAAPSRVGFTPAELAAALDVSTRTVSAWIRSGRVAATGSQRRRLILPDAVAQTFGPDVLRAMLDAARRDGRPVYVPAESAA